MVALLRVLRPSVDASLLRIYGSGRGRLLVCFHHAGGGASSFAGWPQILDDCSDVALVQLPGREDRLRDPLCESLPDLSAHLATTLAGMAHDRLVLLGHSMGATIAWWVAASLWRDHGRRAAVLVSSQAARASVPAGWGAESDMAAWFDLLGEQPPSALAEAEIRVLFRHTLEQDMEWMRREFGRTLPGPIPLELTCVCAADDRLANWAQMSDWQNFTSANFEMHRLLGGHLHLVNRPEAVMRVARGLLERQQPLCHPN